MKCRRFDSRVEKMSTAVESKVHHLKESPVKDPLPIKPQDHHADMSTELSSLQSINSPNHDKENLSDSQLDCIHEDSGYLSLKNSQLDEHKTEDSNHLPGSANNSLSHRGISPICPESPAGVFTPLSCSKRRTALFSLSSTPLNQHDDPNLPILKFQQAVCEELAKSYQKNKKYDWSVVSKVADDHLLDRVIGRQMCVEYVDIFASLLSRNMKTILSNILALLGDMDLISCKKVSRTWMKIICEDSAAMTRCQQAEKSLRESRSSLKKRNVADASVVRVVLSCMQNLPSSSSSCSSSSSTSSCGINRESPLNLKCGTSTPQSTAFDKYVEAASNLKTDQSLRSCRRCGSPAIHSAVAQKATCTSPGCLFDFCTCCQEAFHGSAPCRMVNSRVQLSASRVTPNNKGIARNKRSLRRL